VFGVSLLVLVFGVSGMAKKDGGSCIYQDVLMGFAESEMQKKFSKAITVFRFTHVFNNTANLGNYKL
jgi:hypothetical protein